MRTKSIGEIVREEREHHGISLEDFSKRTRIRIEYLSALEQNQFDRLPAATFVKGYIKTYARVFGFDHEPLLALLRRDYKESAKGRLIPREFIKPVLKKRLVWTPVTIALVTMAGIFCSLLVYVGVQWYNLNRPPQLLLTQPNDGAVVAPQVVVNGTTSPDTIVTVNSQPVSLQPNGEFQLRLDLSREGLTTITVEATDRRGKKSIEQRTVTVQF